MWISASENNEFRHLLLSSSAAGVYKKRMMESGYVQDIVSDQDEEENLVCVTSGLSFLGRAIVAHLLSRGYSVRIAVDNQGIKKKSECNIIKSLREAFDGCRGVFYTSSFIDPAGVTGYNKHMAELEVKASEMVMEACARTGSVKKCVFTSSLLACIWCDTANYDRPPNIDHHCWSDESVCRDKKLWFALGKTMAERAAWRMAADSELKLATICPGLLTGPGYFQMNSLSSVPYLKGAEEMYAEGLLATTDVSTVAKAQVCIYEELGSTASGRYMCFNHVVQTKEEAIELATEMGMPYRRIIGDIPTRSPVQFSLCNRKLLGLMSKQSRCS